ncbi:MAG: hypothetical protein JRC86_04750 [Deltaproteobacteria bacterium]|nr:hypothetical protein [Deltaproteobacteria bacterium]
MDAALENKMLTIYVICEASNIGIFQQSLNLAGFKLGFMVTKEMILKIAVDIEALSPGRYWLPKFCQHQYGSLKEKSIPHQSYMKELEREGLLHRVAVGYGKGIDTPKDKTRLDKDKTGLDMSLVKEENTEKSIEADLELLWKATPPKGRKRSSMADMLKAFKNIQAPVPTIPELVTSMELWAKDEDWTKQNGKWVFGVHRWINRRSWEFDFGGTGSNMDDYLRDLEAIIDSKARS